jgi:methylmalonyl-CoA/ethylmalonyl-CoA epimerase
MFKAMKIHHIGYLVKNINIAIEEFVKIGFEPTGKNVGITDGNGGVVHDESRSCNMCFLKKDGYIIELVSPCGENSVVYNLNKKIGNAPYHICYQVDSILKYVSILREKGYFEISEPSLAPANDNKLVTFLYSADIGMIELMEIN